MEFRILGPVGLWSNGHEVFLNGAKQRTILAVLLLSREQVVSDHQISDVLWGEQPPETYQAQIYTYASRLRQRLRHACEITRKGPGYLLRLKSADFDYANFDSLFRKGRYSLESRRYGEAADMLHTALSMWHGPTLTDVTEYLAESEAPAIDEARMDALECRIEADLALRRHDQLVSELVGLVSTHPLRERLRAQLMLALYEADRQAEAFAVFHEGRQQLEEELGVDPGRTLRETYQAILTGNVAPEPYAVRRPART